MLRIGAIGDPTRVPGPGNCFDDDLV